MNFWYVFAALALFAAVIIAIFLRRRRAARQIRRWDIHHDDLAERIAPFIGHPESSYHMDREHLLDNIGGRPGLGRMRAAIRDILATSRHNHQLGTDASPLWGKLSTEARWALVVGICAYVELWLRQFNPALPPIFTDALARYYWDMVELMDTIRSAHEHTW